MSEISWDKYFMSLAYFVAMKSKDENTNIGAVIVGPDNEIRSTGYNSFVRGSWDELKERQERPEKYYWFEHAERNAIYNAARVGTPLCGCRIYVLGIPCMDCARAIIQSGICEVVVHDIMSIKDDKWREHHKRSAILFSETRVVLRYYRGDIVTEIMTKLKGIPVELNKGT